MHYFEVGFTCGLRGESPCRETEQIMVDMVSNPTEKSCVDDVTAQDQCAVSHLCKIDQIGTGNRFAGAKL